MILLALQYCPRDEAKAWKLAHAIAQLEDGVCPYADILMWRRFDCPEPTAEQLDPLKEKFGKVLTSTTRVEVTGWPQGCNVQWWELARHVNQFTAAGHYAYTGVLSFESDCLPLAQDWIKQLHDEWESRPEGTMVMGDWHGPARGFEHINGNMIFHPMIYTMFKQKMRLPVGRGGWDAVLWKHWKPYALQSKTIYSQYRASNQTVEQLFAPRKLDAATPLYPATIQPALLHGIKSDEELDMVIKHLTEQNNTNVLTEEPVKRKTKINTAMNQPAPQG